MEYFVEQAASHREAEQKVRAKYGDKAKIMHHKTVRMGGFLGLFGREGVEVTGYFAHEPARQESYRRAPQQQQQNLEEEKQKILSSVKSDKTMDLVLKELQSLKEQIGERDADREQHREEQHNGSHPTVEKIENLMEQNDFTTSYIRWISSKLRRNLSMDELEDFDTVQQRVIDWIGESISVYEPSKRQHPTVFVLVGPTGVGKTTTIAKLAAMYGIGSGGRTTNKVRMLTIDNYRIGARQQIETYGEIMDIPVSFVESGEDLKKQMAFAEEADYVFIDTIGKSPREFAKLGEMQELLSGCGRSSTTHLALSATTKTSDMYEVLQQFEPFGYQSVVLTKLDETIRLGNVISVLSEKQKPVSYFTDGQGVPQDIDHASVEKLLINLEGFKIDRQRIEERFGRGGE
jgi:flagellar biosynthesis protein FlhF